MNRRRGNCAAQHNACQRNAVKLGVRQRPPPPPDGGMSKGFEDPQLDDSR